MGMLPKNSLRDEIIKKNLILIRGPYHNFHNVGLPQFTVPLPKDINDFLGAREISKDNSYIEFMSNPNKIPEELKDFPIKINDLIDTPPSAMKKTHSQDYGDIKFASYLRSQTFAKDRKKYKVYK